MTLFPLLPQAFLGHVLALTSMRKTSTLRLVAAVMLVALSCETVSAKTVPHLRRHRHERSHRRFQHLQDQIDRLDLRQKIDHILIQNLQKALGDVQEGSVAGSRVLHRFLNSQKAEDRDEWHSGALDDFVRGKEGKSSRKAEERDFWPSRAALPDFEEKNGKGRVRERQKQDIEVNGQERSDELLILRQELAALRSEVRVLKEERAAEFGHRSSHSIQQEQRESVTASWVVDNVARLQEAVVEMQEAVNVTAALHDKQEVESRLSVVGRDLAVLRSSLSSVTSKAEAAMATVETVREDLVRTAEDSNHARAKVEALGLEVSGIKEEFNGLLSALPDGLTVKGLRATTQKSNPKNEAAVGKEGAIARDSGSNVLLQKAKDDLQPLRDTLDSSVTQSGHQPLPSKSLSSQSSGHLSLVSTAEESRQLEERVRATESGLGEVKSSSIQLLDALESLEAEVEVSVAEVRQEVAKMEFKMMAMQDSANASQVSSSTLNIQALADHIAQLEVKMSAMEENVKMFEAPNDGPDIKRIKNHLDQLERKLRTIQDSAKISQVPSSSPDAGLKTLTSRMDQLALFLASVDNRSISECQSNQLALNHKLNETLRRIESLERQVKKS